MDARDFRLISLKLAAKLASLDVVASPGVSGVDIESDIKDCNNMLREISNLAQDLWPTTSLHANPNFEAIWTLNPEWLTILKQLLKVDEWANFRLVAQVAPGDEYSLVNVIRIPQEAGRLKDVTVTPLRNVSSPRELTPF